MTHKTNGQTAVQKAFAEYTLYITAEFVDQYGASYVRSQDIRNAWRHTTKYNEEIELFLIVKSKTFIRALDARSSNSTNLQFLDALTNRMADYLSAYSAKNPAIMKRKHARDILKQELFHKSSYINFLRAQQSKKHAVKRKLNNSDTNSQTTKRASTSPNMRHGVLVISMVFNGDKSK